MDTNNKVINVSSRSVTKLIIVFKHPNYTEKNISILKYYKLHLTKPLNIKLLESQGWVSVGTEMNLDDSVKICALMMKNEKDYITDAYIDYNGDMNG